MLEPDFNEGCQPVPEEIKAALDPVVDLVRHELTDKIAAFALDRRERFKQYEGVTGQSWKNVGDDQRCILSIGLERPHHRCILPAGSQHRLVPLAVPPLLCLQVVFRQEIFEVESLGGRVVIGHLNETCADRFAVMPGGWALP